MTADRIETAIKEGIPFAIRMADGEKHEVGERHKIAVGKAHVAVIDRNDLPHVLPLLMMTDISYLEPGKNK